MFASCGRFNVRDTPSPRLLPMDTCDCAASVITPAMPASVLSSCCTLGSVTSISALFPSVWPVRDVPSLTLPAALYKYSRKPAGPSVPVSTRRSRNGEGMRYSLEC